MLKPRDSERSKSFLKATIRFQNGNVTMDCIVRNISLSGARLEIEETATVPAEFELAIPNRGVVLQCQLKWRHDHAAGVKFKDVAVPSAAPPDNRNARIQALEAENAELRYEIARLTALFKELERQNGQPVAGAKLNASSDE